MYYCRTSWCRTSLVQIRDTWHLLKSIGNIVRRPSWKVAGQLISCSHGDSIRQSIPLHVVAGFGHGNMLTGSKNQNLFMDRSAVAISVHHFSPVLSQVNWLCMQYLSQFTEPFLRSAWKGRSLFWWRTLWIFDTLYDLPRFSNHDSRFSLDRSLHGARGGWSRPTFPSHRPQSIGSVFCIQPVVLSHSRLKRKEKDCLKRRRNIRTEDFCGEKGTWRSFWPLLWCFLWLGTLLRGGQWVP